MAPSNVGWYLSCFNWLFAAPSLIGTSVFVSHIVHSTIFYFTSFTNVSDIRHSAQKHTFERFWLFLYATNARFLIFVSLLFVFGSFEMKLLENLKTKILNILHAYTCSHRPNQTRNIYTHTHTRVNTLIQGQRNGLCVHRRFWKSFMLNIHERSARSDIVRKKAS